MEALAPELGCLSQLRVLALTGKFFAIYRNDLRVCSFGDEKFFVVRPQIILLVKSLAIMKRSRSYPIEF